MIDIKVID